MRKKVVLLLILISLFIIIEIFLLNKKHKYLITYELNNYVVTEEYNYKIKDSYYINIMNNDKLYSYQFKNDYIGKKIITDIKQYKDDDIECILPLFNNEVIFDVTCNTKQSSNIYLHNMESISSGLTDFINSITQYNINKFTDSSSKETMDIYDIYTDNIIKPISIETYRGIINYQNKIKSIDLFNNDVYNKNLSVYTDNYYFIPNYNSNYEFNEINIVNLKNNKIKTIKLNETISLSSYIQGTNKDIVYLFDLEDKKQYKIDCKNLTIKEIGNLSDNINVYVDGKWVKESVSEIQNEPVFDFKNNRTKVDNNTYKDVVNNYIYTYIKDNNVYKVYKSNKYTPNIQNYLFTISDIDSIIYNENYFYFKKDNYIAYYSEMTGIKKIIQGNELSFNKNIIYNVIL